MNLSEKLAYETIEKLTKKESQNINILGFIYQVAHDNNNWKMIYDLLNKITQFKESN